ncbi:MAG: tetratricopeptide repeat protein [Candidatus Sericytochromatia bacterium]|nr:tetratricopeptide repeat protein [Candidatus Sericytochromatia bacterium]
MAGLFHVFSRVVFLTVPLLPIVIHFPNSASAAETKPAHDTLRLVVLPFKNLTGQADQNWLGESFSESLTTSLSQRSQLSLIERSQLELILQEQGFSQSALADESQAPRLGKILGARKLLIGSYQLVGQTLLIQARLVDVETGQIAEGQAVRVEGPIENLFALQARLAENLLIRLGVLPSASEREALELSLKICKSPQVYAQYQQARILLRMISDKHLSHAIELLEKTVATEPDFVEAQVALSEAFSLRSRMRRFYASARNDDLQRALFHAQEALKQGKQLEAVYRATARAWQAQKKSENALQAIRKSLEINPNETDSLLAFIEIASHLNQPSEQIIQELQRYQPQNSQDPWVQFSLVTLLMRQLKTQPQADYSQVRQMLEHIRLQLPDLAYVPMKQGELALRTDQPDKAMGYYQTAVAMEPDNYLLYAFAGVSLVKQAQFAEIAESWLKKSVSLNPEFGYNLAFLGLLHLQRKDHPMARQYLLQALEKLPDSSAVYSLLGFAAMQQDNYLEAYAYLRQALNNDGKIPGENMERGSILQSLAALALLLEKPAEAIQYSKEALSAPDRDPVQALNQLIKILLSQNQLAAARQEFEAHTARTGQPLNEAEKQIYAWIYLREELQKDPNNVNVLNDLGRLALKEKDPDEALDYLEKAIALAPEHPSVMFNLGLLKLQTQDYAEAADLFKNVLTVDPHHPKAAFNLGKSLQHLGKKAEAKAIWTDLLKLHPDDLQVLKALESLEK